MNKYTKRTLFFSHVKDSFTNPGIIVGFAFLIILLVIKRNDSELFWMLVGVFLLCICIALIGCLRYISTKNYREYLMAVRQNLMQRRNVHTEWISALKYDHETQSTLDTEALDREIALASSNLDYKVGLERIYQLQKWAAYTLKDYKKDSEFNEKIKELTKQREAILQNVINKDNERVTFLKNIETNLQNIQSKVDEINKDLEYLNSQLD